ncbi:MAG: hypothetical protein LBT09_12695 [Planctomycetaceae bacterium]|jgi:hypothetical protein|nr:hypothetical protein [Planctomycetaceae bacterium]
MLRQNPVKKRRGELSTGRRFLPSDFKPVVLKQELPAENISPKPANVIELPDNSVKKAANSPPAMNSPAVTNSAPVVKNISATNNVTKIQSGTSPNGITTAMPDSDWRIGQYNLPEILAFLARSGVGEGGVEVESNNAVDDVGGGVFALLNDGLRKAREFDDKLFISIFETAIRATCKSGGNGLVKETLMQLQQIDGFNECYKAANSINEKWQQTADRKFLRESRIAAGFPLLMFPQAGGDFSGGGIARRKAGYDFFVMFNGNGTVINPSCDFWDGLYQIGGVAGDVSSVVITGRDKIDRGFIERFKFYRSRQLLLEQDANSGVVSGLRPVQFFVPNELVVELSDIPNSVAADIESLQADGGEVMISAGSGLSFQLDQLSLSFMTESGLRWIRFVGQSGLLRENLSGDILVFMVDGVERLFSSIGLSKIADAGMTVFDISQQVYGFTQLFDSVRKYVGASAVAGANLVCELGAGRFLDVVKGFDSDKDVWSLFGEIDSCDDVLYYFSRDAKERFAVERAEIIETFITNRRRRHGLYFRNA